MTNTRDRCGTWKSLLSSFLILLSLMILGLATPTLASENWSAMSEAQSRLYFSLPGDKKYSGTGWNARYSKRRFLMQMVSGSSKSPRAEIVLSELAPGYFFRNLGGPENFLTYFTFLTAGAKVSGSTQRFAGDHAYDWVDATQSNRACIVFISARGQGGGDGQTSDGTSFIAGYYCNPEGRQMTAEIATTVLAAIGTKDAGAPAPEPLVTVSGATSSPDAKRKTGSAPKSAEPASRAAAPATNGSSEDNLERKLVRAKSLFERGLIDKQEYEDLKEQILKEF